jgi:ubiquinone/menaquinone biosynthesis C-methylase UbiE
LNEAVLPFEDETFDLVYVGEVIEHLYDPDHVFEEVRRVLTKQGHFILSTPNLSSWINRIVLFFGYQPFGTEVSSRLNFGKFGGRRTEPVGGKYGHLRVFTYKALREFVSHYGFKIIFHKGAREPLIVGIAGIVDSLFYRKASLAFCQILVLQKQ